MILLGIDTGGFSIKAAPVDVTAGRLVAPAAALPTPQPATPAAVAAAIRELAGRFSTAGPVGVGFPSVIKEGRVRTAAHVDLSWIGVDGARLMTETLGRPCVMLNDADAAGLAEMRFGAGRGLGGTIIVLTLGTGIGSAIFNDGVLLPNTEFGHLEMNGAEAEQQASGHARIERGLSWADWAGSVNEYLRHMHRLFWPDAFILCGGVTENYDKFGHLLHSPARIKRGDLPQDAGIVGAALAAAQTRP
jgi:polyphosphate glucokinase